MKTWHRKITVPITTPRVEAFGRRVIAVGTAVRVHQPADPGSPDIAARYGRQETRDRRQNENRAP